MASPTPKARSLRPAAAVCILQASVGKDLRMAGRALGLADERRQHHREGPRGQAAPGFAGLDPQGQRPQLAVGGTRIREAEPAADPEDVGVAGGCTVRVGDGWPAEVLQAYEAAGSHAQRGRNEVGGGRGRAVHVPARVEAHAQGEADTAACRRPQVLEEQVGTDRSTLRCHIPQTLLETVFRRHAKVQGQRPVEGGHAEGCSRLGQQGLPGVQGPLGRLAVARRARPGSETEQDTRRRAVVRRDRPVEGLLPARKQGLVMVVRSREEAPARVVLEVRQQTVGQHPSGIGPGRLARGVREIEQTLGQVDVVLAETGDLGTAAGRKAEQGAVGVAGLLEQEAGKGAATVEEHLVAEVPSGTREGREQQAVPRGDDLVVEARAAAATRGLPAGRCVSPRVAPTRPRVAGRVARRSRPGGAGGGGRCSPCAGRWPRRGSSPPPSPPTPRSRAPHPLRRGGRATRPPSRCRSGLPHPPCPRRGSTRSRRRVGATPARASRGAAWPPAHTARSPSPHGRRRTPGRAGRCRTASSRSAAAATARRCCSGGSRRRRGRGCRRPPWRRGWRELLAPRGAVLSSARPVEEVEQLGVGRELGPPAVAAVCPIEGGDEGGVQDAQQIGAAALERRAARSRSARSADPLRHGRGLPAQASGADFQSGTRLLGEGSDVRRGQVRAAQNGSPSGVSSTVIGQPPRPAMTCTAFM